MNKYLIVPFVVIGDIITLLLGLLCALTIRASAIPQASFFAAHSEPFFLILISSLAVFYTAGLYDLFSLIHIRSIIPKIGYSQLVNVFFSVFFFYFITIWGITPKTVLVLYVLFSTGLLFLWRVAIIPNIVSGLGAEETVIISGTEDGKILFKAISLDTPYHLKAIKIVSPLDIDFREIVDDAISKGKALVVNFSDINSELIEKLYLYTSKGGKVLNLNKVYEEVFGKVTQNTLSGGGLPAFIESQNKKYDAIKRLIDLAIATPAFVVSLVFYPFVYLLIKFEDRGPIFFTHPRMGKGGVKFMVYKFRTMTYGDNSATWVKTEGNKNKVTKIGKFLRVSRIDELPQLINVIKGDMSLIGPRPDLWALAEKSAEEIPYYYTRVSVMPGLSGWAQTQMHKPPQNIEETKERLLHDLYYIKYRSFSLDILIVLKTIKTLLSREGM